MDASVWFVFILITLYSLGFLCLATWLHGYHMRNRDEDWIRFCEDNGLEPKLWPGDGYRYRSDLIQSNKGSNHAIETR